MGDKFWMVWRQDGSPPTYRHETIASATQEAERLALAYPGERFYVLEARAACMRKDVTWEHLTVTADDDDIPF